MGACVRTYVCLCVLVRARMCAGERFGERLSGTDLGLKVDLLFFMYVRMCAYVCLCVLLCAFVCLCVRLCLSAIVFFALAASSLMLGTALQWQFGSDASNRCFETHRVP